MDTGEKGLADAWLHSRKPVQNGGMLAHLFVRCKHLFAQALTRTGVRARLRYERMFVQGGVQHVYPRPRRRRGWGRVVVLAAVLLVATGRLAYGSGPMASDTVVVRPGDTVWSIAAGRFSGDPRPYVAAILVANHLGSPALRPGQTLRIPRE